MKRLRLDALRPETDLGVGELARIGEASGDMLARSGRRRRRCC
jgi:hypothetical protein